MLLRYHPGFRQDKSRILALDAHVSSGSSDPYQTRIYRMPEQVPPCRLLNKEKVAVLSKTDIHGGFRRVQCADRFPLNGLR